MLAIGWDLVSWRSCEWRSTGSPVAVAAVRGAIEIGAPRCDAPEPLPPPLPAPPPPPLLMVAARIMMRVVPVVAGSGELGDEDDESSTGGGGLSSAGEMGRRARGVSKTELRELPLPARSSSGATAALGSWLAAAVAAPGSNTGGGEMVVMVLEHTHARTHARAQEVEKGGSPQQEEEEEEEGRHNQRVTHIHT